LGENGTKFYIILKGVVSVQIRNPAISDYAMMQREFKNVKAWKEEEFD